MSDPDSELLRRCGQGEEAAWRELVARHSTRVFALARRFLGSPAEAEDLTQEVFVRVYQALARRSEGSFAGWLSAVTRNLAIDRYRRTREERVRRVDGLALLDGHPSSTPDPAQQAEMAERRLLLRQGVAALPLELREALVLCDLQGLAGEDAALALGVAPGTLKSRLHRARLELARRMRSRTGARA